MARERTCVLVKPDGMGKKVAGMVLDRLEREGYDLIAARLLPPRRELIEDFYSIHKGKAFYPGLLEFMMEGPILAFAWEGEDAVSGTRRVIGVTDSKQAAPGTLRNLYGTDNRRNLVHASDSAESAAREIGLLFRPEDIVALSRV